MVSKADEATKTSAVKDESSLRNVVNKTSESYKIQMVSEAAEATKSTAVATTFTAVATTSTAVDSDKSLAQDNNDNNAKCAKSYKRSRDSSDSSIPNKKRSRDNHEGRGMDSIFENYCSLNSKTQTMLVNLIYIQSSNYVLSFRLQQVYGCYCTSCRSQINISR